MPISNTNDEHINTMESKTTVLPKEKADKPIVQSYLDPMHSDSIQHAVRLKPSRPPLFAMPRFNLDDCDGNLIDVVDASDVSLSSSFILGAEDSIPLAAVTIETIADNADTGTPSKTTPQHPRASSSRVSFLRQLKERNRLQDAEVTTITGYSAGSATALLRPHARKSEHTPQSVSAVSQETPLIDDKKAEQNEEGFHSPLSL